jgi:hypothetical protein
MQHHEWDMMQQLAPRSEHPGAGTAQREACVSDDAKGAHHGDAGTGARQELRA